MESEVSAKGKSVESKILNYDLSWGIDVQSGSVKEALGLF